MRRLLALLAVVLTIGMGSAAEPTIVKRLGSDRFRQQEHVEAIAYSPDGKQIATADEASIHVWDASDGRRIRTFPVDKCRVFAIQFTGDGQTIVAGANIDNKSTVICRCNLRDGKTSLSPHLPDTSVGVISTDGKWLAIRTGAGNRFRLVDTTTAKILYSDSLEDLKFHSFAFRGDCKWLAVGKLNGHVEIVDVTVGKVIHQYIGANGAVWNMGFSPDGKDLVAEVSSPGPNHIVRFEAATGTEKWTLPASRAHDLTFDKDGKSIRFFGHINSEEPECWRWLDAQTGKPLPRTMEAERGYSNAIRPDGKALAVGGYHGHISQWDLQSRKQLDASADPVGLIADLHFNPEGMKIRGFSRGWYEWDVQTGKQTRLTPPLDVIATYDIAVSRDQKWHAWTPRSNRPLVHVKDLENGRPPQLLGHAYYQECLRFLPNGRLAVTYGDGESLRHDFLAVYRLATGSPDFYLFVNREKQAFAISPDVGSAIVMSVEDDHFNFKTWNLATTERSGESIGRLDDPSLMKKSFNWNVQLSANATRVAVSYTYVAFEGMGFNSITEDHTAIFEVRTGRFLSSWVDLPHRASVAFSPDGRSAACYFRSILGIDIREAATGGRRARISDLSTVSDACFTPDGSKLAVGASPGPIVLYDLLKPTKNWDPEKTTNLWDGLASDKADIAYEAICLLRANPVKAISFLKERMKLPTKQSAEWIVSRINDLDSAEFRKREMAGVDLAAVGEVLLPELRSALTKASPEARERLNILIAKVDAMTPEKLRAIRVCEALEGIASAEAKALLAEWAKGPAAATLTREAMESLDRLARRKD